MENASAARNPTFADQTMRWAMLLIKTA